MCSITHKILLLFLNLLFWGLLFVRWLFTCIIFPWSTCDRLHSYSRINSRTFHIISISVRIKIVYFHSLSSISGGILLHVNFRIVASCNLLLVNRYLRFFRRCINVLKIALESFGFFILSKGFFRLCCHGLYFLKTQILL